MFTLKAGYRHYHQLMDIAFWVLLIGYGRGLMLVAGVPKAYLLAEWRPLNLALGSIVLAVQFMLLTLIMLRHLRDEYAEQVWQRAAGSLVRVVTVAPFLWFAFTFVFLDTGGWIDWLRGNPAETVIPQHAVLPNPTNSAGIHQFEALSFAIIKFSQYFPLAFAALYKWHRWQDER